MNTPLEQQIRPLRLLILQPTPFCNINCQYCYLADRNNRTRMDIDLLPKILDNVHRSGIIQHPFTLLWHSGEPLTVPPSFYQEAFEIIYAFSQKYGYRIENSIQTNGTLISDEFCLLFKQYNVDIGLSIDGPQFLHDRQRVTRSGKGTFDKVIKGIRLLQKHEIPVKTISVLTSESLKYPEEIYNFFIGNNLLDVAFNVEEAEGINYRSSLQSGNHYHQCKQFFSRFYDLVACDNWQLFVREFSLTSYSILRTGKSPITNIKAIPFSILTIDVHGNFSTFAPELLQTKSQEYNNFVLGNIQETLISDVINTPLFQQLHRDIQCGVSMCKQECEYFSLCGGGCPSCKYTENHSMRSTETMYCKLHVKALIDVVLEKLEQRFIPDYQNFEAEKDFALHG